MKVGKYTFEPIPALIGWSIAALIAWGIHYFTGFSFWAALAILVISMLINGIVADAEDNAPGGFNNPLPPTHSKEPTEDANDKTRNA